MAQGRVFPLAAGQCDASVRDLVASPYEVREVRGADEFSSYYDLRWRILREPWTQSRSSGQDTLEEQALHLGCWLGNRLVGTGRLHFNSAEEAQIRFMAVEDGFQGKGIGGLILRELERRARAASATRIVLDARDSARPFYERYGYQTLAPAGLLFDQIVHWKMGKQVATA
jgi:GNAT superfamily N-acetyltransferase